MKAKNYIKQYNERVRRGEKPDTALTHLISQMMTEVTEIANQRAGNNPSDSVLRGVLREQDLKWRSIAYQLGFNPNGWCDLLRTKGITL